MPVRHEDSHFVARRADCNNDAGCSPATGNNFGTVTITDVTANVVSVDVDLWNSFTWAKTGLIGFALISFRDSQVQYTLRHTWQSEERVDERGQNRTLAEHGQRSIDHCQDHDRDEPEFLAHQCEAPQIDKDAHYPLPY